MFRIYPNVTVSWRSDRCIQFGVRDPVLIDGLLPADIALIDDLRIGVSSSQFFARAQDLGADLSRAGSLLSLLREAGVMVPEDSETGGGSTSAAHMATAHSLDLAPERVSRILAARPVAVLGPVGVELVQLLSATGFEAAPAPRCEQLDLSRSPLVITSSYLVPDLSSAMWLSDRQVDHLEIVLGESDVEISGLIRPGRTPCTLCTCLHRRDADAFWLDQFGTIAALPEREEFVDPLARTIAAVNTVQLLRLGVLDTGAPARRRRIITVNGELSEEELVPDPACECRRPIPRFDLPTSANLFSR